MSPRRPEFLRRSRYCRCRKRLQQSPRQSGQRKFSSHASPEFPFELRFADDCQSRRPEQRSGGTRTIEGLQECDQIGSLARGEIDRGKLVLSRIAISIAAATEERENIGEGENLASVHERGALG